MTLIDSQPTPCLTRGSEDHVDRAPHGANVDGSHDTLQLDAGQVAKVRRDLIILNVREMQVHRNRLVSLQTSITNSVRSLARRALGWSPDLPDGERAKIAKRAASIVAAVEAGDEIAADDSFVAESIRPFCETCRASMVPLKKHRAALEKAMSQAVRTLPVYGWVENVKGLGALGLATVIGESGDLTNYSNPAKLWKRLGLAVFDGRAQRRTTDKMGAAEMGYNPRRRSRIWSIADSLLRNKGNAYYEVYRARREYEVLKHPEFDKGIDPKTGKRKVTIHCDRRARRYAEKRMIRDLWRAWRDAEQKGAVA